MGTCALYASFGLYLIYVWTTTGRVDCGCLGRGEKVGPLTVLRALLLATAAALGSIAGDVAGRPSVERWLLLVTVVLPLTALPLYQGWVPLPRSGSQVVVPRGSEIAD